MMHPTEDTLLAYLDGEVTGAGRVEVDRHLSACESCRASFERLREASALLTSALGTLDLAEPARWGEDMPLLVGAVHRTAGARTASGAAHDTAAGEGIRAGAADPAGPLAATGAPAPGAGQGAPVLRVIPGGASGAASSSAHVATATRGTGGVAHGGAGGSGEARSARRRTSFTALRWAAGILLVAVGAGTAAVVSIPGLQRLFSSEGAAPVATTSAQDAPLAPAAVAVHPAAGAVEVVLTNVADGSRLQVAVEGDGETLVEVTGQAQTRFLARDGLVRADLGGAPATVRIVLPGGVETATIKVDDRVVASAAGGVVTPAEAATGAGIDLQARD